MDRRLLPYEYQLIEALGVTKEEYLEFVALQQEYKDPKAGTALDVRNDLGITAIVLTVVGALFQVGAALLTPKLKLPDISGPDNQRRTRQQRFAPSSGFNSAPELASYGDTVNLVYTSRKDNPEGGVRVSGSLVWSVVDNFGSAQFMQLLFVLGAAEILNISYKRTAFGSMSMDQLDPSATFLFYKGKRQGGPPVFDDIAPNFGDLKFYPEDLKRNDNQEVCKIVTAGGKGEGGREGFSQAYSPTTSSSFGIYDPIPVKVEMVTRDSKGEEDFGNIGITVEKNDWSHPDYAYNKNDTIQVRFQSKSFSEGDSNVSPLALNFRRQAVNALDFGSTYMLGSAKFRLTSFGDSKDPDYGDVNATFTCIEDGICPSAPYDRKSPVQEGSEVEKKKLEKHLTIIKNETEDEEVVPDPPTKLDKDFQDLFATEKEKEKESNRRQYVRTRFKNTYQLGGCKVDYNFENKRTVRWTNAVGQSKSESIDPGGSIEYTKELERQFMEDPPTLNSKLARTELRRDRRRANAVIAELNNGDHDESEVRLAILGNISLEDAIENKIKKDERKNNSKRSLFKQIGLLEKDQQKLKNIRGRVQKNLKKSKRVKQSAFNENTQGDVRRIPSWDQLSDNKTGGMSLRKDQLNLEQLIADRKQKIQRRINILTSRARKPIIKELEDATTGFISLAPAENGGTNEYQFGGLERMDDLLDDLQMGKKIVDEDAINAVGREFDSIEAQKRHAKRAIDHFLENWEDCIAQADNNFFVKALVKADSASYETVSEVDQVKFSIKSRLFRRISGRQKKYGEVKASKKYSLGDNGIHGRQAFFRFSYKKASESKYEVHKVLFVLRQSSESDAYTDFNFQAPTRDKYSFKIDPVYDVASEIRLNGQSRFAILDSNEKIRSTTNNSDSGKVWYHGAESQATNRDGWPNLEERGPKLTNEWDVFSVNTDTQVQFSFENGPEMALTAVSEQQIQNTDRVYRNLSVIALSLFAGRNIQDLRNVTTFVEEGKKSYKVEDFTQQHPSASTSYAPDIFVDTVLDKVNGIGKYAPTSVLDQDSLKLAKAFCQNNNLPAHPEDGGAPSKVQLFMDCVIADNSSWREFWVNNAPFSLLEFARKNGRETLVPVLPTRSNGKAAENDGRPISMTISGLFTTGNILEDSYKEEFLDYGTNTQDLIATVVYREEFSKAIFQRRRTVRVSRKQANVVSEKIIRETFDASGFITTRQQAILFGKMLVNQRRFIRRGIEFKTFPSVNPVEPGAFIYVDIGLAHWERTSSGVIAEGGALNSPLKDKIPNGTYDFLVYNRDNKQVVAKNSISVLNGVASALSGRAGQLYVMGISSGKKRVFRITEVEMDQDGEVTVRAIEYPCDDQDRAHVADFRPSEFDVS